MTPTRTTTSPREFSRIYSNTPASRAMLRAEGHEPNALRYTSAFQVQQLRFHYLELRKAGASAYTARRALWSAAWGATLYPAPTFETVALTPTKLPAPTGDPLTFDECEAAGVDGSGRFVAVAR